MRIYIPTKGRTHKQVTLSNLPRSFREQVTIVCPEKEALWHQRSYPTCEVLVQPDPKMGISEKRKWIVDTTPYERIVMLDDDLRFAVRREDDPGKFRPAVEKDIIVAFSTLDAILDGQTPHAGFAARGGSIGESAKKGGWQEGKRQMYVLGYHIPTVREHAVFGRLSTHEDMDVTLQLLTKGFPNLVNFTFVVDQKFGNPGGCTDERTVEINNADSLALAALHPGFVRTTKKEYTGSTPRVEVVCAWVKALEYGLSFRK